jgi:hypothetical protein
MSDQNKPDDLADMLNQASVRQGNQIFANNGVEAVSKQEYVKRELGFELPTESVPLPSRGTVYPEGSPLHNCERVEFRSMTAKEEDILMNRALIKKGTVITELLKSCMTNKNIDVNALLSGDRNALMIAIRSSGYGSEYTPSFQCPKCDARNDLQIDLADLELKRLTIEPVSPGKNHFRFKLPVSKIEVDFRFLTGEQEEKIVKEVEMRKNRGMPENAITTRFMQQIIAVNGDQSPGIIAKFVNHMPARDSLELRRYLDKHEPGVKMEVEFMCSNCSYADTIALPMDVTFLWPGSK